MSQLNDDMNTKLLRIDELESKTRFLQEMNTKYQMQISD